MTTAVATHTTTTPAGQPIDDGLTTTILRQQQGRQVERWHDNNDGPRRRRSTTTQTTSHDDNGPRRQPPTMTTTHDDSGLRRQRPMTIRTTTTALATTQRRYYVTAAAGSNRVAGVVGFVANEYSNYVNEYKYSHSRVLGAQMGTRAASTSITPENLASTRTDEYESSTSCSSEISDEYSYSRVSLVDISSSHLLCARSTLLLLPVPPSYLTTVYFVTQVSPWAEETDAEQRKTSILSAVACLKATSCILARQDQLSAGIVLAGFPEHSRGFLGKGDKVVQGSKAPVVKCDKRLAEGVTLEGQRA
ncbi:hypothetical protein EDB89DRAFT_1903390 [Lactarius sanguifluus]|nr:hypothetical protein EDB89DRAFT_1903390 [Lactarius sanguifluus]